MARYIDALVLKAHALRYVRTHPHFHYGDWDNMCINGREIDEIIDTCPTEDVAPRVDVNKLEYTLLGVMHSVDKWLDGNELEQDEVNRAIIMREKTLRIIENLKAEVAREIIADFKKLVKNHLLERGLYLAAFKNALAYAEEELKKKYTEEENNEM